MKRIASLALALAFAAPAFQAYAVDPLSEYAMAHEKMMKASPAEAKKMKGDMMKKMDMAMKEMDTMPNKGDQAMMQKRMDMMQMMMMDLIKVMSLPG